ncbi:MAG: hypothetical protein ACFE0I_01030 [Elainellaceae cyanobacterium]
MLVIQRGDRTGKPIGAIAPFLITAIAPQPFHIPYTAIAPCYQTYLLSDRPSFGSPLLIVLSKIGDSQLLRIGLE